MQWALGYGEVNVDEPPHDVAPLCFLLPKASLCTRQRPAVGHKSTIVAVSAGQEPSRPINFERLGPMILLNIIRDRNCFCRILLHLLRTT